MAGWSKRKRIAVAFTSMIPSLIIMATHWSDTAEMARLSAPALGQTLIAALGVAAISALVAGLVILRREHRNGSSTHA
jgi:hypothetical protein